MDCDFSILLGKTITGAWKNDDNSMFFFETSDGETYQQWHRNDCCEHVYIESVVGDIKDILNSPVLLAEVVSGGSNGSKPVVPPFQSIDEYDESWTWTFYKLSTIKGSITIRWYGSSNGYYSESVDFSKVE